MLAPLIVIAVVAKPLYEKRPGFWTISVQYPAFSSNGPAAKLARTAIEDRARFAVREFRARAKAEIPSLRKEGNPREYELKIVPHRITDRGDLVSGYVERYDYIAGAHGTTRYEAFNYGPQGALRLKDLFVPGADAAGECSTALLAAMKGMKDVPSNLVDGSWTRLTPEEADRFVVGQLGVLFLFDQYDVGYGAQGAPKVLVPFDKLKGLNRNGPLKAIFSRR